VPELDKTPPHFAAVKEESIARCRDVVEIPVGGIDQSDFNTHPAQFPHQLAEWVIKLFTKEGDTVCDPFCGAGNTLVAARNLKRNFIGFEISPEYCEIANKRLNGL